MIDTHENDGDASMISHKPVQINSTMIYHDWRLLVTLSLDYRYNEIHDGSWNNVIILLTILFAALFYQLEENSFNFRVKLSVLQNSLIFLNFFLHLIVDNSLP